MASSTVSLLQRYNFYVTDFPSQLPSYSFKEPQKIHLAVKAIKGDKEFKCNPELAHALQSICADALSVGIAGDEMRGLLPHGVEGITSLNDKQALRFADQLNTRVIEAREANRSMREEANA